ncbi:MAG: hypothetical protein SGBAC_006592 [Bacillariaceae sp.]
MTFSLIRFACEEEVRHVCGPYLLQQDFLDLPCGEDQFKYMPYQHCHVNGCLVGESLMELHPNYNPDQKKSQISDQCKKHVRWLAGLDRIMTEGPQNWREELIRLEIYANAIALEWLGGWDVIVCLGTLILCGLRALKRYSRKSKHLPSGKERDLVEEIVAGNGDLKQSLEELIGECLNPLSSAPSVFTPEGLQFKKGRVMMFRAIYSSPELRNIVQAKMEDDVLLGATPPLIELGRVFNPPHLARRRGILRLSAWAAFYILVFEPFGDTVDKFPAWVVGLLSVYSLSILTLWPAMKHSGNKSTCCACQRTTLESDSNRDDDCRLCSGTGVCSLECNTCMDRLNAIYPTIHRVPDPPPSSATSPFPKSATRLFS